MHKRPKKSIMYIKLAFVLIIMVGLTFLVLEVPGIIYKREDVQLVKNVSSSTYDVSSLTIDMDEKGIAEALYSEDTMFIKTNQKFTQEEKEACKTRIIGKLSLCLGGDWLAFLKSVLHDNDTVIHLSNTQIISIINDNVYSAEIGILSYYDKENMSFPCSLVFDQKSGKLIRSACILNIDDEMKEYMYSANGAFLVETYIDGDNETAIMQNFDIANLDKSFILPSWYEEHYEEWYEVMMPLDEAYLYISPFDGKKPQKSTIGSETYLTWDLNEVMEKLTQIINEQEMKCWE